MLDYVSVVGEQDVLNAAYGLCFDFVVLVMDGSDDVFLEARFEEGLDDSVFGHEE